MQLWQRILIKLLYLTPIGYILGMLSLLEGKSHRGLKIIPFPKDIPIVSVEGKPSFQDRVSWFTNGVILIFQGWFALQFLLKYGVLEEFISWYGALAFLFGFITLVSTLFPKFPWNKRIF